MREERESVSEARPRQWNPAAGKVSVQQRSKYSRPERRATRRITTARAGRGSSRERRERRACPPPSRVCLSAPPVAFGYPPRSACGSNTRCRGQPLCSPFPRCSAPSRQTRRRLSDCRRRQSLPRPRYQHQPLRQVGKHGEKEQRGHGQSTEGGGDYGRGKNK